MLAAEAGALTPRVDDPVVAAPARLEPRLFTPGRWLGVALWLLSSVLFWLAIGHPLPALLGVPGIWLLAWVALGSVDSG